MGFLGWLHKVAHRCRDGTGDGGWSMVGKMGNLFALTGGQPFYVNGFNTYWLMVLAADPSTRAKVTEVFQQASSVGFTVCRTWAFSDGGWRALQKSPSVYDEEVFKALDFVVSEASKYRIRLVLPLCNNWEGFGGKPRYVEWGKAAGLDLNSEDDFYSDTTVKGYYKAHVRAVLSRVNTFTNVAYKDDPTIFAWELMNEPQCTSDPSGDKLQAWIEEMAEHVKSIDAVHLLGIGSEGFYGPATPERSQLNPNALSGRVGTDFVRNHTAPGIDFASAHIYPDLWLSHTVSDSHLDFAKAWMEAHIQDAGSKLGMPMLFGEFGVSSKDDRFDDAFREAFIGAIYDTLLSSTGKGGAAGGCLLWQLFPEGVENMDDGYAVVLAKSPAATRMLALQSQRLRALSSRCSWKCRPGAGKRNLKRLLMEPAASKTRG
ncbi:hypothetical protein Taro_017744 [Colocasia esculenta]|uniref:mannan endo-1,4-beta-mannosidase n=1 Tax=Colocasia esculenta TaxID=4460 RepID=A0A843UWZ6_COLES|nr:hypothetical protein [Colocasia esculenta]